jgi:hypothetical protein
MTRYELDEESGLILMLPGESTEQEALELLGKALCLNSSRLAKKVGVPDQDIRYCETGKIEAIEHNLKEVSKYLTVEVHHGS